MCIRDSAHTHTHVFRSETTWSTRDSADMFQKLEGHIKYAYKEKNIKPNVSESETTIYNCKSEFHIWFYRKIHTSGNEAELCKQDIVRNQVNAINRLYHASITDGI